MEDNYILLMKVLKIHYKNRLHILNDALKVIKEYSNIPASTKDDYNDTTNNLQQKLNDLPSEILKYFLTMIPVPKIKDNLTLNNYESFNMHTILTDYLNQEIPVLIPIKPVPEPILKEENKISISSPSRPPNEMFKNTTKSLKRPAVRNKRRGTNRGPLNCKKLLDLCADYVVQNHVTLTQDYQIMKEEVWKMVSANENDGDTLKKLYAIIRDLNKKIKWLRQLEADDITDEIIREYCKDEEIYIKERNLDEILREDPFVIGDELKLAISNFLSRSLNSNSNKKSA